MWVPQSNLAPNTVQLLLQVPEVSADPHDKSTAVTWADVSTTSVPLRTTTTKLSGHCVLATGVRVVCNGRRSDNKLNVVALGRVVVNTSNPSAVYTPTLTVLSRLQNWLHKVSVTHPEMWPAALSASLHLAMSSASLSSLLRFVLSVVGVDGDLAGDDDVVTPGVWQQSLTGDVTLAVRSALATIKVHTRLYSGVNGRCCRACEPLQRAACSCIMGAHPLLSTGVQQPCDPVWPTVCMLCVSGVCAGGGARGGGAGR